MAFKIFLLMASIVPALGLMGCAHTSKTPSSKTLTLKIGVRHLELRDAWRVTFQTSEPTSSLVFERQVNKFRAKTWKSLTEGVTIVERNGKEQITSPSPFSEASFEFDSYTELTPKDYEFFQTFSDGSLVLYTGHFNACPVEQECKRPVEFLFTARTGERGIVQGSVFNSPSNWIDETNRGTYVYFGSIHPIQTKYLTAIIDPNLPHWISGKLDSLLPRLFEFYAKRTGVALTFKPFVFLNFSSEGTDYSSHGGTLPGLIQLSLSGKGWSKPDVDSLADLARFLAHESAHLWNGQLFPYQSGDMWMHEGGADAFAYLALLELKAIEKSKFLAFQTEAFNSCLSLSQNRPLMEVTEDPDFLAHYRCGSMMALLSHAASLKKNRKEDLFFFWHQLFEITKKSGKPYTEESYFSVLDRTTGNTNLSQALKRLLRGPELKVKDAYLAEFKRLGVKVEVSESNFPEDYNRRYGKDAVRSLMKKDCSGNYGLTSKKDGLETDPLEECLVFKTPLYITELNHISIHHRGAEAYDDLRKSCRRDNRSVSLTVKGALGNIFVACPEALPIREEYFKIVSIPLSQD